jgi:RND family efflux transporter MFP subunit
MDRQKGNVFVQLVGTFMYLPYHAFRAILGSALCCAVVVGCSRPQAAPPPAKPPSVLVALPVSREVTDYEEVTGRTEAVETVEVRARVTGYLKKVHFEDGATVEKDDPLFQIDPDWYEAELARAVANVNQGEARVRRLEADQRRTESLVSRNAASQADVDRIQGDLDEAVASLEAAKAARKLAEINLAYSRVVAPFSGVVSRRAVDPGNLVKADETTLTSIIRVDPIYVYFAVDERTLLRVRRTMHEGQFETSADERVRIRVGLADEEGRFPHEGTIDFVDNRVDPETGTLRLRGVVPNSEKLLSPGLFVRVRVQVGKPYSALLVPERALGSDQGQKFLYVVSDSDEATQRQVKVGSLHEGLRVVTHGLEPGERIIVSGLQRVRSGMQVEPKMTEPAESVAGM